MSSPKTSKEIANKKSSAEDAKPLVEKIFGDISKSSATKQIFIGGASGWITGFVTMKVGKVAACAVGGGIILLQIASDQGYIKVNWDKIKNKAEKITDKVEEKITGEKVDVMDKVERFVDKKLDKTQRLLKEGEKRARCWYHKLIGIGEDDSFQVQEFHFFLVSFAAGVALGVATAK